MTLLKPSPSGRGLGEGSLPTSGSPEVAYPHPSHSLREWAPPFSQWEKGYPSISATHSGTSAPAGPIRLSLNQ